MTLDIQGRAWAATATTGQHCTSQRFSPGQGSAGPAGTVPSPQAAASHLIPALEMQSAWESWDLRASSLPAVDGARGTWQSLLLSGPVPLQVATQRLLWFRSVTSVTWLLHTRRPGEHPGFPLLGESRKILQIIFVGMSSI